MTTLDDAAERRIADLSRGVNIATTPEARAQWNTCDLGCRYRGRCEEV